MESVGAIRREYMMKGEAVAIHLMYFYREGCFARIISQQVHDHEQATKHQMQTTAHQL